MAKKISDCGDERKVPVCQIKDLVKIYQAKFLLDTGRYISVPRAIVKMIQEKY
jgi:hypothetical protein